MKIKELHPDIERYLNQGCYCPHEVYSLGGFFYRWFYEDQECKKLGECHIKDDTDCVACIAHPDNKEENAPQVVVFWLEGDKCYDAVRYDATENNIEMTKIFLTKGVKFLNGTGRKFDCYDKDKETRNLKDLLSLADAVMVD